MTNSLNFTAANDSVMALAVDQSSGQVSQIGPVLLVDGLPGSLVCDPSGQFVFVVSSGEDTVTGAGFLHVSSYAISTSAATAGQLLPQGEIRSPIGSTISAAFLFIPD